MRFLAQLLLGISSGLPLLAIGSTLKAWLLESGLSLTSIGLFSAIGLPYTLKFLWAPIFDRYSLPFLGRRKGWIFLLQTLLALSFCTLSTLNPNTSISIVSLCCLLIAFFSASQDIVIDAARRDLTEDKELGLANGFFVNGYRLGMLISGALALNLAEHVSWGSVYLVISTAFTFGIIGTFLLKEGESEHDRKPNQTKGIVANITQPFKVFFKKPQAIWLLSLILLYKFGDSLASEMTTPFLLQLGYTKASIGNIAKTFGLVTSMLGALVGGWIVYKIGISKSLWIFGLLQAVSTLGFSYLTILPVDLSCLALVIGFENLSAGMGTTAYAAFMAHLCDKRFSATQYALLSSIMGVPRVIFGSSTGYLATTLSWPIFFVLCTVLAIPGMLILLKVAPWKTQKA